MNENELRPIADTARRSGRSVSAVRFYSNEGLVTPAGHRMYTIEAIARLEPVRTLRDLDTDLTEIRRLLQGETALNDLLTTHLTIVENQERACRARRVVLGTLIKQGGTTVRADLMHKLVSMAGEEREQAIDDFWNEIEEDLGVPDGFVDRIRELSPRLPDEPTVDQLQAWIELGDPVFREEVRTYLHQNYGVNDAGHKLATTPAQELMYETGPPHCKAILAVHRAGKDPRSLCAQEIITRFLEMVTDHSDQSLTPELRNRMAKSHWQLSDLIRQSEEEGPAPEDTLYDHTHGRYQDLVERINGSETELEIDDEPAHLLWMADVISVPTAAS